MIILIVAQCLVCVYVCMMDSFQYTALRNHRSVPQQTTGCATGQAVCTFISGYLSDGHALIGGWWGCPPLVCGCAWCNGAVRSL